MKASIKRWKIGEEKMTSSDKQEYITVEMFKSDIQEIKSEIREMKQEIKDTRNELMTEIRLNQNDVAHLQTSIYWGFAIIGVVIGIVGLIFAIMPQLKEKRETQKNSPTFEEVNNIVEAAINKALAGIGR